MHQTTLGIHQEEQSPGPRKQTILQPRQENGKGFWKRPHPCLRYGQVPFRSLVLNFWAISTYPLIHGTEATSRLWPCIYQNWIFQYLQVLKTSQKNFNKIPKHRQLFFIMMNKTIMYLKNFCLQISDGCRNKNMSERCMGQKNLTLTIYL